MDDLYVNSCTRLFGNNLVNNKLCLTYRVHMSIVNEYNGYNDDGSDESNFEAFDDESPFMNDGNAGIKVSQTSEFEFDNRRILR